MRRIVSDISISGSASRSGSERIGRLAQYRLSFHASRRLYARARSNSSIAIGYGHPATVRAAESDVSAKRRAECACMANGNDATTTAPTISSTDTHRTNMKRIRRSLRARTTSAMSIAS